jgi:hypothetical protein
MAPRSEEAAAWFATVYRAIQEIPEGKVTTYSQVARLVGYRKSTGQRSWLRRLTLNCKTAERPRYCALTAPEGSDVTHRNLCLDKSGLR